MPTAPAISPIVDRWAEAETGAGGDRVRGSLPRPGSRPDMDQGPEASLPREDRGSGPGPSSPGIPGAGAGTHHDGPGTSDPLSSPGRAHPARDTHPEGSTAGSTPAARAGEDAGHAPSPSAGATAGPDDPALTIHGCARTIMEVIPAAMHVLRMEMRRPHRGQLSVPQFRALLFIQRHPGISASRLAEHLGVTRPTASALLDRLVQRGLVSRVRDPQERRRVVLHLTPSGVRLVDESRRHTQERLAALLAGVPAQELNRIVQGLELLQNVLRGMVT